jgi:signal transduction histidine kinase
MIKNRNRLPQINGNSQQTAWETLRAVIEDISGELQLRPLLTRIVIHACHLIGADNGTIGLYDPKGDLIRTEAAYQMPVSELGAEMPRGVGLAGTVLQTGQPVVLKRYGQVNHPTQMDLVENAVVGVPILWRDDVIGVFGIGGAPNGRQEFYAEDIELLSLFARHAAIAIVNAQRYESEQTARQETQLLFDTSARMSAATDIHEVVIAYLDQVATGGKFNCTVTEYVWTDGNPTADPVWVRILGTWTTDRVLDLSEKRHPFVRDFLDDLLDRGKTVAISDVHTDPRVNPTLREIQKESGRPALALIPLRGQGPYRLGHVILSAPEVHEWTEEELRRYQVTAAQLATALDIRRQQELIQQRQRQLGVLEERRRLARDLHDAVTQMLFSLHLIAQAVPPVLKKNPEEAARRIDRVVELSHSALTEMRALLAELKPADDIQEDAPDAGRATTHRLLRDGLARTLEAYIAQVNDAQAAMSGKRPRIYAHISEFTTPLPFSTQEALLRIAQEATSNALKHAKALHITITLRTEVNTVLLLVEDDGAGFSMESVTPSHRIGGIGLTSMRERAVAVGGEFLVFSKLGQGTQVCCRIPITPDAASRNSR